MSLFCCCLDDPGCFIERFLTEAKFCVFVAGTMCICVCLCVYGNRVFICGDGASMARDVLNAFIDILVAHSGTLDSSQARVFMQKMLDEKRYVQDIWG